MTTAALHVSEAFHSPLMADKAQAFAAAAADLVNSFSPAPADAPTLVSSRTGKVVEPMDNAALLAHLTAQITEPVRFTTLVDEICGGRDQMVDVLVKVGPGKAMTVLSGECQSAKSAIACIALEGRIGQVRGLLEIAARSSLANQPLDLLHLLRRPLHAHLLTRPRRASS